MSQTVVLMLGSCIVTGSTTFAMSASSLQNFTPEQLIDFLQNCEHEASILRKVYWDNVEREIPPVIVLANNDDSHYTQVFRNRSQLNAFIDQLRSQADEIWPAEDAFRFWWDNEGSGMFFKFGEEDCDWVKRNAKIAWANGAYVGCGAQEVTS
jgi:hypothetical protein